MNHPIRTYGDSWEGQLSFTHDEERHRSQRFELYRRFVGIVIDQAAEIAESIGDRNQSEHSEDSDDLFVSARVCDLGSPRRAVSASNHDSSVSCLCLTVGVYVSIHLRRLKAVTVAWQHHKSGWGWSDVSRMQTF